MISRQFNIYIFSIANPATSGDYTLTPVIEATPFQHDDYTLTTVIEATPFQHDPL